MAVWPSRDATNSGVDPFLGEKQPGFRDLGLGFRVEGLGFRVQDLGFRVEGLVTC